jgi:hypothetical protein
MIRSGNEQLVPLPAQFLIQSSGYEGICEGTEQAQRFRMEWQRGWNEYNQ